MAQSSGGSGGVTHYVRYESGDQTSYGILDGDAIQPIEGDLFGSRAPADDPIKLADVKLRYPCEPPKVLCVGLNYKSHLAGRTPAESPEIFYKPPTALQDPGGDIVIPAGSKDLHYEAEFVIVISRKASRVSEQDAPNYIFGYTSLPQV